MPSPGIFGLVEGGLWEESNMRTGCTMELRLAVKLLWVVKLFRTLLRVSSEIISVFVVAIMVFWFLRQTVMLHLRRGFFA
jgi:hypothetical protein